MNDDTILSEGRYKGKKLKDVPDKYFLDLYDDCKLEGDLKRYAIGRIPLLHFFEDMHLKDCYKQEETLREQKRK